MEIQLPAHSLSSILLIMVQSVMIW